MSISCAREWAVWWDKRVLLVDFDPQSNASLALFPPDTYFNHIGSGRSISSVLTPGAAPDNPFDVVGQHDDGDINLSQVTVPYQNWKFSGTGKSAGSLDVALGNLDLMRLAFNSISDDIETILGTRWKSFIDKAKNAFDLVVVDCHPAGSFFTKHALLNSDAVVVPVTSDPYAAAGLNMMNQTVDRWSTSGGANKFYVLFNDVHKDWDTSVEAQIRNDDRYKDRCVPTKMVNSSLVRSMAKRHQVPSQQPVSYRFTVGRTITRLSRELVAAMTDDGVIETDWSQ